MPALALACTGFLLGPATSSACACGPTARFVVAHGTSPHGALWRIKADEAATPASPRFAEFEFIAGKAGERNDLGYFSGIPLPLPPSFIVHANSGDGIYPELEGDMSGFARAKAVRLVATMSDDSSIEIETKRPPTEPRKRFPWLRGLVFFDQFYAADIEPVSITAYGRDGRRLFSQDL